MKTNLIIANTKTYFYYIINNVFELLINVLNKLINTKE